MNSRLHKQSPPSWTKKLESTLQPAKTGFVCVAAILIARGEWSYDKFSFLHNLTEVGAIRKYSHTTLHSPLIMKGSNFLTAALTTGLLFAAMNNPTIVRASTQKPQSILLASSSISSPELFRTMTGHEKAVNAVSIADNNRTVISGSSDKTLKVWNLDNGELERTMKNSFAANVVMATNDGSMVISSGVDRVLRLFRVNTGDLLRTYSNKANPKEDALVRAIDISPDGNQFATARVDKTVQIWDFNTGDSVKTFKGHTDYVLSVAFSRDRRSLVSGGGGYDRSVRVWDIESGTQRMVLEGHQGWVLAVAVSPNGRYIASASNDETIKIWEMSTGKLLRTLEGHKGAVRSIAFAPDNNTIYSGSMDRTIKEWEVETGRLMRTLTGHTLPVLSIGLSPNGRLLASGSEDKTVKIWKLER